METQAERDTAVGYLAVSIRQIGPSTRRFHAAASKIPSFDTLTVYIGMRLVRGDPRQAGCGGGLPRSEYSPNWAVDSAISRCLIEDSLL